MPSSQVVNTTLGPCGETQKRPVCTDSGQGRSKLHKCQRQLLTALRSGYQILPGATGIVCLGSKRHSYTDKVPLCSNVLLIFAN